MLFVVLAVPLLLCLPAFTVCGVTTVDRCAFICFVISLSPALRFLRAMVLPAKVQASIMSWLDESSTAVPSGQSGPAAAEDDYSYPVLTPADLFSLSSRGFAAGSPGVVVKDGFLGREQALRAHAGESIPVCLSSALHAVYL